MHHQAHSGSNSPSQRGAARQSCLLCLRRSTETAEKALEGGESLCQLLAGLLEVCHGRLQLFLKCLQLLLRGQELGLLLDQRGVALGAQLEIMLEGCLQGCLPIGLSLGKLLQTRGHAVHERARVHARALNLRGLLQHGSKPERSHGIQPLAMLLLGILLCFLLGKLGEDLQLSSIRVIELAQRQRCELLGVAHVGLHLPQLCP
mmetsp:Transcript_50460/g.109574  ORF Transcript_50460/g.109574 Transcript_50460/m.109574 type:complete len:204 (+) Transcript_50460:116-727(+)